MPTAASACAITRNLIARGSRANAFASIRSSSQSPSTLPHESPANVTAGAATYSAIPSRYDFSMDASSAPSQNLLTISPPANAFR